MRPMRLLFETPLAARDVAFMVRCEYDGCNMITLPPVHDTLALKTAIELTGANFCFDGDHYPLVLPQSENEVQLNSPQLDQRISHKAELWCDQSALSSF